MSPKFKILDKKNIHDGFFKMNEVTLKYKKYDGNWSNEIKRELFGGAQVSAVLPYDPDNKKIVLIQQFRPGTIFKKNHCNAISVRPFKICFLFIFVFTSSKL